MAANIPGGREQRIVKSDLVCGMLGNSISIFIRHNLQMLTLMCLHWTSVIESLNNEHGIYEHEHSLIHTRSHSRTRPPNRNLHGTTAGFPFRLISFAKLKCHSYDVSNLFKFKLLFQVPFSDASLRTNNTMRMEKLSVGENWKIAWITHTHNAYKSINISTSKSMMTFDNVLHFGFVCKCNNILNKSDSISSYALSFEYI